MTIYLRDTMVSPDGTTLNTYVPNYGPMWDVQGTWVINSNEVGNTANEGDVASLQDAGQGHVICDLTITTPGVAWNSGFIFNVQDRSNFWLVEFASQGAGYAVRLWSKIAGTFTAITTGGPGNTYNTVYSLRVTADGNNVGVAVNGTAAIGYTAGGRPLQNATSIGLRRDSAGGATAFYSLLQVWDATPVPVAGGLLVGGGVTAVFTPGTITTAVLITSNSELLSEVWAAFNELVGGHCRLMLFSNPADVRPSMPLSALVECTYDSYQRLDTHGLWSNPYRKQEGWYILPSRSLTFAAPVSAGQNIWGWALLTPDGMGWRWASRFQFAVEFLPGGGPLVLLIQLDWLAWQFTP